MNWEDYLTLSKEIITKKSEFSKEEACFRCASSRAYYSALHRAKEYLLNKYPEKILNSWGYAGSSHDEIINTLDETNGGTAVHLRRLKKIRKHSDYQDKQFNENLAKQSIMLAEYVFQGLQ